MCCGYIFYHIYLSFFFCYLIVSISKICQSIAHILYTSYIIIFISNLRSLYIGYRSPYFICVYVYVCIYQHLFCAAMCCSSIMPCFSPFLILSILKWPYLKWYPIPHFFFRNRLEPAHFSFPLERNTFLSEREEAKKKVR